MVNKLLLALSVTLIVSYLSLFPVSRSSYAAACTVKVSLNTDNSVTFRVYTTTDSTAGPDVYDAWFYFLTSDNPTEASANKPELVQYVTDSSIISFSIDANGLFYQYIIDPNKLQPGSDDAPTFDPNTAYLLVQDPNDSNCKAPFSTDLSGDGGGGGVVDQNPGDGNGTTVPDNCDGVPDNHKAQCNVMGPSAYYKAKYSTDPNTKLSCLKSDTDYAKACTRDEYKDACDKSASSGSVYVRALSNNAKGSCITFLGLIKTSVNYALLIASLIAAFMLLRGGFKYTMSRGDPAGLMEARDQIMHATIGVILLAVAYIIILFLQGSFGFLGLNLVGPFASVFGN